MKRFNVKTRGESSATATFQWSNMRVGRMKVVVTEFGGAAQITESPGILDVSHLQGRSS